MHAEPVELLALTAASLAFAIAFSSRQTLRPALLMRGTAGLAGVAAIAFVPTVDLVLIVLLALGVVHAAFDGRNSFARLLRAPGAAAGILALALVFARVEGPQVLERFAAVGLAAGLAAAVGVLPYIHESDPEDGVGSSPVVWVAFIGPVLASVIVLRAQEVLSVDAGGVFGAILIGLGLLNMVWGSIGSWLTEDRGAAWRYAFMADWGLAMCGFGLVLSDGSRAALLILFAIVLGRFPLYLVSRSAPAQTTATERPVNLVVAALLAGSAPFAGFAARVLLLRASTELFWPLALVLGVGMLLWLPGSLRLGRSLGLPRGRQAVGVALVIVINVIAGLYPLPLLSAAGL